MSPLNEDRLTRIEEKVDKLSDFRLALLDDDRLTLLPFEDKKLDASFKLSFDTFTAFPDPV